MYQQFFGLRELPFELTPNPRYLYLTRQHREALGTLLYGLSTGKGVTVLIAEAGTGKTTLLHAALRAEQCRNVTCAFLTNPTLTRQEFLEILSAQFHLSARAAESKAALLEELERVLVERRARGEISALVIDEAQSLSDELLEEIRLLANIETETQKLLSLVLAGQPELKDRLNEQSLRQLKQRVTLRSEITPFTRQETAAYIASRIRTAGGDAAKLFTREAVVLIHERSGGIPRLISVMCDNALLTGFGLGRQPVNSEIVLEVARDFDLNDARARDTMSHAPVADELHVTHGDTASDSPARVGATRQAPPDPAAIGDPTVIDERPMFSAKRSHRFSFFGGR